MKKLPAGDKAIVPVGYVAPKAGIINPVSAGLNVALTVNQRFAAKGAPITSFDNPVIDDLERDIFWSMYLWQFDMLDTPPEGREGNRVLFEWLLHDPNYLGMRGQYANRLVSAAATSYEMTKTILDNMPNVASSMQGMGEAENLEDEADNLDQQADNQEGKGDNPDDQEDEDEDQDNENGSGDGDGEGDDQQDGDSDADEDEDEEGSGGGYGDDDEEGEGEDEDGGGGEDEDEEPQESPEELREQAEQKREEARQKRQQAQQQLEKALGGEYANMMRANAVKEGQDFGDEVGAFLSYWGFEEGQGLQLSIEEIRKLMELLGKKNITDLTILMGRVHSIAREVLRGRADINIMIDSYGITSDVQDMSVDQQALLSTSVPDRLRRYYIEQFLRQGGMPGYTRTSEARNEGAFLGAVDESSSMETPLDYSTKGSPNRNIVAKALALGLARAARENDQPFSLIGFSSQGQISGVGRLMHGSGSVRPVTEKSTLSELLTWGTENFNGGTDFDSPLTLLMDLFEGMDEEARRGADLLFITDGQATVNENTFGRFMYLKELWGLRLHLLLIGDEPIGVDSINSYYRNSHSIVEMADSTIEFTNLDNIAAQIAEKVWD